MFFVDANVLVYALSPDERREPCLTIIQAVAEDRADGRTSTAVLEEVWHLERRGRLAGMRGATGEYLDVFSPLLPVTHEVFERALALGIGGMGTNDCLHAATCLVNSIPVIVTADVAFERVKGLRRVDPLDERAVRRLLR